MALKANDVTSPSVASPEISPLKRPNLKAGGANMNSAEVMKTANELDNDGKIEFFSRKIDEEIVDLDTKLDNVLEKHEKDFLKAYRVQMLKVQDELSALRQRANEKEL